MPYELTIDDLEALDVGKTVLAALAEPYTALVIERLEENYLAIRSREGKIVRQPPKDQTGDRFAADVSIRLYAARIAGSTSLDEAIRSATP